LRNEGGRKGLQWRKLRGLRKSAHLMLYCFFRISVWVLRKQGKRTLKCLFGNAGQQWRTPNAQALRHAGIT
jgi:hypothetical protein